MEYQTFGRTTLFIGLLKNLFHQGGVTVWRNGVGKNFPGKQVNDHTNGINVLLHSSIRDVAHPNSIGGVRIKILLQSVPAIFIVSVCGSKDSKSCLLANQSHFLHQICDMLLGNDKTCFFQLERDFGRTEPFLAFIKILLHQRTQFLVSCIEPGLLRLLFALIVGRPQNL